MMEKEPIKVVLPLLSLVNLKVTLDLNSPISKIETLSTILFSDIIYAEFGVFKYPSIGFDLKEKLNWIKWESYPDWIYLNKMGILNEPSYYTAYNLMEFARQNTACIFFTDREEREEIFMEVINSYPHLPRIQQYREILNKSMLVQNILGFLIFNELSPNIKTISDSSLNAISRILPLFKRSYKMLLYIIQRNSKVNIILTSKTKSGLRKK